MNSPTEHETFLVLGKDIGRLLSAALLRRIKTCTPVSWPRRLESDSARIS